MKLGQWTARWAKFRCKLNRNALVGASLALHHMTLTKRGTIDVQHQESGMLKMRRLHMSGAVTRKLVVFYIIVVAIAAMAGWTSCDEKSNAGQQSTPPGGRSPDGGLVVGQGSDLSGVAIRPAALSLGVGEITALGVTVSFTDFSTFDDPMLVTWSSGDPSVASVSPTGLVMANQQGETRIRAEFYYAEKNQTGFHEIPVTVTAPSQFTLRIQPSQFLLDGNTKAPVTVLAIDAHGRREDVTAQAELTILDGNVAHVLSERSQPTLSGVAEGRTWLVANHQNASARAEVVVQWAPPYGVRVEPAIAQARVGTGIQYRAYCLYRNGTEVDCTLATTWSMCTEADARLATITATGYLQTIAGGTGSVCAAVYGATGSATLNVDASRSLEIDPKDVVLRVGDTQNFQAWLLVNGIIGNATNAATWSTNGGGSFDGPGSFRAETAGVWEVTVDLGGMTARTSVTVVAPTVRSLEVTPNTATIAVGEAIWLNAIAIMSDGSHKLVTSEALWVSAHPDIVTTARGITTGAAVGVATVQAVHIGHAASATVTVIAGTGCGSYVQECTNGNGGCAPEVTCTPLPNGRTCGACPAGYRGNGAVACTDIDECAEGTANCSPLATCTNVGGGFTCTCLPGHSGDGITCLADVPTLCPADVNVATGLFTCAGTEALSLDLSAYPATPVITNNGRGIVFVTGVGDNASVTIMGTGTVSLSLGNFAGSITVNGTGTVELPNPPDNAAFTVSGSGTIVIQNENYVGTITPSSFTGTVWKRTGINTREPYLSPTQYWTMNWTLVDALTIDASSVGANLVIRSPYMTPDIVNLPTARTVVVAEGSANLDCGGFARNLTIVHDGARTMTIQNAGTNSAFWISGSGNLNVDLSASGNASLDNAGTGMVSVTGVLDNGALTLSGAGPCTIQNDGWTTNGIVEHLGPGAVHIRGTSPAYYLYTTSTAYVEASSAASLSLTKAGSGQAQVRNVATQHTFDCTTSVPPPTNFTLLPSGWICIPGSTDLSHASWQATSPWHGQRKLRPVACVHQPANGSVTVDGTVTISEGAAPVF